MKLKIFIVLVAFMTVLSCSNKSYAEIDEFINAGVDLFFYEFKENGLIGVDNIFNNLEKLYKKEPRAETAVLICSFNMTAMMFQRDFIKTNTIKADINKNWEMDAVFNSSSKVMSAYLKNKKDREDFLKACLKIVNDKYQNHILNK